MKRIPILVMVVCGLLGLGVSASACNIPVFRYALENWQPDPYSVFILHRGDFDATQQKFAEELAEISMEHQASTNARFFTVDTRDLESGELDLPLGSVDYLRRWLQHSQDSSPSIVALFPDHSPQSLPAWHGEFTEANLKSLIDSPLRREISQRILDGQSAVWVLIESGDQAADDAAFLELGALLAEAPNVVSLPDRDLIETDDEFNASNEIELKVEFSALRVSRESPEEAAIVSMLLGSEEDLRDFDEPIAIPVYGRGRTYFALIGKGINADTVNDNCQFLCGACSCQIKQDNPGIDLMMAMNWQDHITESAMNEVELPELTGIGGFEIEEESAIPSDEEAVAIVSPEQMKVRSDTTQDAESTSVESAATATMTAPVVDETGSLFRRRLFLLLVGLLAFGLVFAVGSTLMLRRRTATR